jgi:transcriptional regulator with XRE-family HTH domain
MPKLKTTEESKEFDKKLGLAIKQARAVQNLSLMNLSRCLGITYQMLQRHEKGSASLTVYRLIQISRVLELPVSHFLADDGHANAAPSLPMRHIRPPVARALAKLVQTLKSTN